MRLKAHEAESPIRYQVVNTDPLNDTVDRMAPSSTFGFGYTKHGLVLTCGFANRFESYSNIGRQRVVGAGVVGGWHLSVLPKVSDRQVETRSLYSSLHQYGHLEEVDRNH